MKEHTVQRGAETVIWDFNGTLVSDVELVLRALNPLLHRRDMPC